MTSYANNQGRSGIRAYEIGETFIRVQFNEGKVYTYTYDSAGAHNVERMKVLAEAGEGLHSFVNRVVRDLYE